MRKFFIDTILSTVFIFCVLWALEGISELNIFDALDPISQALEDTELTDYAFSSLRVEDPPIDTNIIIVNTGKLSREMIGRQIEILSSLDPKVIAVDVIFACDGGLRDSVNCPQAFDAVGNSVLGNAVKNSKNIVMAHKLWQTQLIREADDLDVYDSIEHTDAELRSNAYEGFVNLITGADHQEDLKICREFNPFKYVTGEKQFAFSVVTAMLYDSATTEKFLEREKEMEIINYRAIS